ncbi:MAG: TRAP transporter substrate-binding protein [Gammaproteobacteria bacterium]|nr:TRAP transporter substrate-binding protein [Gammaproteobacteria bacterium]
MHRRTLLTSAVAGFAATACSKPDATGANCEPSDSTYTWKMVTSWPTNFPGFGSAAQFLADTIERNSNGRLRIRIFAADELVPAFEVFDTVSRGTAELGHSAPVYWKGAIPSAQFFSGIPFGMLPMEFNAWLYHGGGQELWTEAYAPFSVLPFSAGNTGPQMGGWFRREINSLDDLVGLKMRMPGLGAEVLQRAGATPVNIAGADLFTALQTGAIDATEWAGPYNDQAFGLHKIAPYYYYPGWHEPSGTLECLVNTDAFAQLPEDLQAVVRSACRETNEIVLAEFTARNQVALRQLVDENGVELRRFPEDVLSRLKALTTEVIAAARDGDALTDRVAESYSRFQRESLAWREVSTDAFLDARSI